MKQHIPLYICIVFLFSAGAGFSQELNKKKVVYTTDSTVITKSETIQSCQKATQVLGEHVMKGNMMFAYDNMYPRYRKRQISLHGAKKFKQQFIKAPEILNEMGVTISSFKAEKPVSFFRVWPQIKPDIKLKLDRGELKDLKKTHVYYNKLVIIPTTQVWIFTNKRGGKPRKLKRKGFQIAIAKETAKPGTEKWTFIDGDSIKPQELRSVFPSLPHKLVLPKLQDSEIK